MSEPLTLDRLKGLLRYDPITGIFTWRLDLRGCVRSGDVAGSDKGRGYIRIVIDGRKYYAHRLAWFYLIGRWPTDQIDHINQNKSDNRFNNLREADNSINHQNQSKPLSNNTIGFLGVRRARKKFAAAIKLNKKVKHIGTFDTPELAHAAYLKAKRVIHEGCTI